MESLVVIHCKDKKAVSELVAEARRTAFVRKVDKLIKQKDEELTCGIAATSLVEDSSSSSSSSLNVDIQYDVKCDSVIFIFDFFHTKWEDLVSDLHQAMGNLGKTLQDCHGDKGGAALVFSNCRNVLELWKDSSKDTKAKRQDLQLTLNCFKPSVDVTIQVDSDAGHQSFKKELYRFIVEPLKQTMGKHWQHGNVDYISVDEEFLGEVHLVKECLLGFFSRQLAASSTMDEQPQVEASTTLVAEDASSQGKNRKTSRDKKPNKARKTWSRRFVLEKAQLIIFSMFTCLITSILLQAFASLKT